MYKYFHLCTHEGNRSDDQGERRIVQVKNDGTLIDVLIRAATVLRIEEVRVISYDEDLDRKELVYDEPTGRYTYEDEDEDEGYYDDPAKNYLPYAEFFPEGAVISSPLPEYSYEPYVHNRIKWNVVPPQEYEVTIWVKFAESRKKTHEARSCPHCQGKGWFVDIIDNSGRFHLDEGIEKITQRIIKDLLTELYSSRLNLEYGTLLKQTVAAQSTDDEMLFDDIRMIVSEVEDNYLSRQSEFVSTLSLEETLRSCTVSRVQRSSRDKRGIVIELKIQTELEIGDFQFIV